MENEIEKVWDSALKYIEFGWPVIPLHTIRNGQCTCFDPECKGSAGKHPRINDWTKRASTNLEQIASWRETWPTTNLAIVTGQRSGLYVLDIDARHDGFGSLEELEVEFGKLPQTVTANSGGGGRHLFFSHKASQLPNRVSLRPGIDFRGDGGMITAPPSRHLSGQLYSWDQVNGPDKVGLAELPDWLANLIALPMKSKDLTSFTGTIPEGARNESLFKLGCSMRSQGFDEETILEALWAANLSACNPPLGEAEVRGIAQSCGSYDRGPSLEEYSQDHPYIERAGKTILVRGADDKGNKRLYTLANFVAWISREEQRDNGLERKMSFVIEGRSSEGGAFPALHISAEGFSQMNWPLVHWGAAANVFAGQSNRDNLRAAIQQFSSKRRIETVYTHIGWREIGGQYFYLHAGGAIGPEGNNKDIRVDANEGARLSDYLLPDPPTGEALKEAVQASLEVLNIGPTTIGYPILCSTYRAPLGEVLPIDFSMFIEGLTGTFKTEATTLAQQHFGVRFNSKNLPANWSSTANWIEIVLFLTKDAVAVIDDFVPGNVSERDSNRVIRGQGNKEGRGRMRPDGTLRPVYYPRALPLISGEGTPKGGSKLARIYPVSVNPGDINEARLTMLQKYGAEGRFAEAMSGYIHWLAPRMNLLRSELTVRKNALREQAKQEGLHKRTPDTIASLAIGLEMFLKFAGEIGVMSDDHRDHIWHKGWHAIGLGAEVQKVLQSEEDHAHRFVKLIDAQFMLGGAYLELGNDFEGGRERWGWREGHPCGERIGWVTRDEVWLHPEAAFNVAQRAATSEQSPIPLSKETLFRRLSQQNLIRVSEGEGKNVSKRKIPGGGRIRVLVFSKDAFSRTPEAPEAPVSNGGESGGWRPTAEETRKHRKFYQRTRETSNSTPNEGGLH